VIVTLKLMHHAVARQRLSTRRDLWRRQRRQQLSKVRACARVSEAPLRCSAMSSVRRWRHSTRRTPRRLALGLPARAVAGVNTNDGSGRLLPTVTYRKRNRSPLGRPARLERIRPSFGSVGMRSSKYCVCRVVTPTVAESPPSVSFSR